eukprot:9377642-Pyramimonas_sp.AAC.1
MPVREERGIVCCARQAARKLVGRGGDRCGPIHAGRARPARVLAAPLSSGSGVPTSRTLVSVR